MTIIAISQETTQHKNILHKSKYYILLHSALFIFIIKLSICGIFIIIIILNCSDFYALKCNNDTHYFVLQIQKWSFYFCSITTVSPFTNYPKLFYRIISNFTYHVKCLTN